MTTKKNTTTQQVIPNPTGKGGFGDNPENRNPGGWKKEDSIPYQYNKFMRMTQEELSEWLNENKKSMTIAQTIALNALQRAQSSLSDLKEVTDRTTGKAKETIEHTILEAPVPLEDLRDK